MVIQRKGNTNKVPLKLQVIPTEMHDIFYQGKTATDKVRNGIRFVGSKPATYYFRKGIQEQLWHGVPNNLKLTPIPAEDLVHEFIRDSPGQWIGIPFLASVLIPLYELDELVESTVAKQKAAQAIAWIIENSNPLAMTPTGVPTAETGKDNEEKIVFKSTGGNTQYLNKGESIKFYQSTDIGANLPVLIQSELRRVASSIGIPYHSLTGDTGDLDFSSLRAIAVEFRQRIEFIHHFYTIPLALEPITKRFKELAKLYSSVSDAEVRYQLPRWYGVDDLKDSQADVLDLSYGISTLQKVLDERHLTFEDVLESADQMKQLEAARGAPLGSGSTSDAQGRNNKPNSNSTSS
jgi:lambda family phage portal protein